MYIYVLCDLPRCNSVQGVYSYQVYCLIKPKRQNMYKVLCVGRDVLLFRSTSFDQDAFARHAQWTGDATLANISNGIKATNILETKLRRNLEGTSHSSRAYGSGDAASHFSLYRPSTDDRKVAGAFTTRGQVSVGWPSLSRGKIAIRCSNGGEKEGEPTKFSITRRNVAGATVSRKLSCERREEGTRTARRPRTNLR